MEDQYKTQTFDPDGVVSSHIQAKLYTKQKIYSVADVPYSIPISVTQVELNCLIKKLLVDSGFNQQISFDFLINGEFISTNLKEHIEEKSLSSESVLEIEYIEKQPAPEPENSLVHDDWVSCIHSIDKHIITGCYDNTVRIWSNEGELRTTVPAHIAPVKTVKFICNNSNQNSDVYSFISGSHDETIIAWRWDSSNNSVETLFVCRGHTRSVDTLSVNPLGDKFCSGSWDQVLKIWTTDPSANSDEVTDNKKIKKMKVEKVIPTRVPILSLAGHKEGISSTEWMDESQILTASWDHTIRLWDLSQSSCKTTLNGPKVFLDISYSKHNQLVLSASSDRHIRLYDPRISDGAIVKSTFSSHGAWVSSVCWSSYDENKFVSGSYDTCFKLWDVRSCDSPLYDMRGHEDKILAVDWSPDQFLLSGGADNHLKVYKHKDLK